jgi:hypothetical protein
MRRKGTYQKDFARQWTEERRSKTTRVVKGGLTNSYKNQDRGQHRRKNKNPILKGDEGKEATSLLERNALRWR